MILPNDVQRCTGLTDNEVQCHMKQNCKRYLSYIIDNEIHVLVGNAPNCIEHTPLECPLKIPFNNENQKNNN